MRAIVEKIILQSQCSHLASLATAIERNRLAIHGKQALRTFDAPERVAPYRDEKSFWLVDCDRKGGRGEHGLIEGAAHRRDAADLAVLQGLHLLAGPRPGGTRTTTE